MVETKPFRLLHFANLGMLSSLSYPILSSLLPLFSPSYHPSLHLFTILLSSAYSPLLIELSPSPHHLVSLSSPSCPPLLILLSPSPHPLVLILSPHLSSPHLILSLLHDLGVSCNPPKHYCAVSCVSSLHQPVCLLH